MNRLLRILFFTLAVLLVAYAALFANYLHTFGLPVLRTKMVTGSVVLAAFLVLAGWCFPLKINFKTFVVLFGVLLVELILEAAGWLSLLPNMEARGRGPYARVYWTQEGHSNGIRNRYGWYAPAFDLSASHKIALIGDSQVAGVEVPRSKNQGVQLQKLLRQASPDWAVLPLAVRGISPSYYIELLDYACRHFQPTEAIIFVSIASDVGEALPAYEHRPARQFIFYDLDTEGRLVLNPASAAQREHFDESLELNHRSLLFNLPAILNGHCMILQLTESLHNKILLRRLRESFKQFDKESQIDGFNPAPFMAEPTPDSQLAMKIMLAELQECKNICDGHGMKFRVVTLPSFPKTFYDTQHGRDWTMQLGDYDFFGPEREVAAWARTNGVPIVSIGEVIRQKNLDVEEIQSLYFSSGTGHLTEKGHAFCAQAIYENFYRTNSP